MGEINKIQQTLEQAEQHCKAHGSRLTPKRKRVLSVLVEAEKALSAYELIDMCKTEFDETFSATSMYRILDFLQSEYLVHKLNLANKYVACADISCTHEHATPQFLICGQCQKVKEISISQSTIAGLQHNIEAAGFQLVSQQLEMDCICEDCVEAGN